ncbi:trinucleotide repeat-containing gene 6B protein-like [Notolabrus celidotus]|uniref:trinucleotide repeat-containing gene 6B protein-like n=1 Tax=Notolabrus celidotus TaxID=1203425 RepID=UPI00149031AD|nr:trinucleotide repeat-containing gene 6B protein-like [Notolabrus celidotus]XP_034566839.1 trinucleotide repeat-containing gene 6B protein-like [Notolabrus celidotus]
MEDKKKKKEDKKKRETSQKVPEQKIKVPESAKPSCSQPLATQGSVSPSPGPLAPPSPSPGAAQVPPGGGNNAKQRTAVANGQPSSSPSGSQTSQQQRYMSREVPPRFRCQQDHKVLLKRGQPPLSSMLLGGGGGEGGAGAVEGGSGWAASPPLPSQGAENPNANTAGGTDSILGSSSASPPNSSSSSSCVAAPSSSSSSITTTSTYANSTWGAGSGSLSSSQGCGKVIVDGTDLGDWPSILGGAKLSSDGAGGGGGGGGMQEQDCPGNNNNSSASWSEKNIQQKGGTAGGGVGNMDNPSSPRSSPLSSSSSLNECVQSSGGVWGSSTSSQVETGLGSAAFYNSKVSHLLPGPPESPVSGSSGVPGANFNPNMNPSAWPALVQGGTSTSASDSLPLHSSITSVSSFSASTTPITTHSLSSVNQTGLHQQHTETAGGARGGEPQQHLGNSGHESGSGGGPGPNHKGVDERDYGTARAEGEGGTKLAGSSSSSSAASSSSWRSIPAVPTDLSAGASQADGWGGGGGGTGAQVQEGNVWGFGSQGGKTGWARGGDGGSNTTAVSQGALEGGSTDAEWGGTEGGVSSSNSAIEGGRGGGGDGGSSSSSSSSGGVGGGVLQESASPKFATMTKAWDNQKGMEGGEGAVGEWGGQGGSSGGERPSSSSGGGSIAGSVGDESDSGQKPEQASSVTNPSQQTSNAEVALLSMLNRSDLDPRVLSNQGWGQTQIRQNVAWDLDTSRGTGHRNEKSSSSAFSSATMNTSAGSGGPGYQSNSSASNDQSAGSHKTGPASARDGWDGSAPQAACGPHMPGNTVRKPGSQEEDMETNKGKAAGGWGDLPPENKSKGWGSEESREQQWGGRGGRGGGWRDFREQGSGWADGSEDKRTGGWKGTGRGEGGGWGGDWGQRDTTPGGDGRGRGGGRSDEGSSWGNLDEGGSQRGGGGGGGGGGGWGDGGGGKSHQDWESAKPHAASAHIPNSQVAPMKAPNQQQHQSQGQQQQAGPQGGWNSRSSVGGGGPPSKNQNQSSGWTSGPIPQVPAAGPGPGPGPDSLEPSGWEEPSPQSISRKMEIDDGTSAWGDPTRYNTKNVNLWDKNSAPPDQGHSQQAAPQPPPTMQQQQPPRRQQGMQHSRDTNPGNAAVAPGMWGGGAQSADNGTGAWGQTSEAPTGWGDPDEPSKAGWGNPSPNISKPGPKSMESWGGKGEGSVAASRHPSWDEEDDGVGGVWNSAGPQGSGSSFNSGGWGQSHMGKRGNIKGGSGDSWMNPVSRQFSNMGLLGDDPGVDKKMDGDKRGMSDYNGEMRRGGRSGGGYRMPSSKDMGPVDMGPYSEKMSGHGVFVGGGGGIPQPRGMHQPGMHPMNPSQGIRAQVPHQFLSAQVPGPMLKQMPSPGGSVGGVVGGVGGVGGVGSVGGVGGVGGGVFPPQISPQQLAMLSNIYPQMQQFHLACQLLLQQQQQQQQLLQNQRKFPQPQPLRQQPDPQQLARIMAILQQQRQHQQGGVAPGGGSSKLSPSHLGGGLTKQPMGDPLQHPGMGGALSDLHAKTQGMYSGLAPGGNLSGLELGPMMGGMKDTGGQQSRFKWMMEGHSPAQSPPDTTLHKNGPLPSALKVRGGSPYSQYEMLGSDGLGIPPQGSADNWHRTPGSKMGNKPATSSWPPEFQPGVPWKGIQSAGDPESDPYMTPGGVLGSPGPPNLNDSDHQLLRDNIGPNPTLNTSLPSPGAWPYSASDSPLSNAHSTGKYSEYKPSWPPEPIGQNKLWKTNRNSSQLPRPPPGLTNQKQASPSPWGNGGPRLARSWGGSGMNQESRYGPGSAWSDGVASRSSCWLLLSNLTPQIDGSTLRTICMQHGPLLTFHLGLTQGSALIRYSTRQEAAKAQGALHMCVLGNTTILAEFVGEEEVSRYFAHSQAGGAEGAGSGAAAASGTQGSSGTGTAVASSGGSSPGNERAAAGATSGGNGNGGGGVESGSADLGGVRSSGSAWQGLDGTGSSSETSSAQGPGLGIFSQWGSNGAGEGGGVEGVESGRSGLWGGMSTGYPSSSLWGASQMEERHQMDSPAALLPGDLLGGGADSI